MSDSDDDDFGGFESAELGTGGSTQADASNDGTGISAIGSDNLAAASGDHVQILDWILSNNAKSDTSSNAEMSGSSLQNLEDSKVNTQVTEDADAAESGAGDSCSDVARTLSVDWSKEFSEAKENLETLTNTDLPNVKMDSDAVHRLQAELDAALVMKEQTEKSLEALQNELEQLTMTGKQDLLEKDRQLEKEISELKRQHKIELEELEKLSEKAMQKLIAHQSEVWKVLDKEKSSECEALANSVVEKCLDLMKQQHSVLHEKLEESTRAREDAMKECFEKEQDILNESVQKKLEEGKIHIEKDIKEHLMEQTREEATKLQELHSQTLKEAMSKQQQHFEESLRGLLSKEREKFTETLKEAVQAAQLATEKEMERKIEAERNRAKTHSLSLKMLLKTALDQIEQRYDEETDNTEHGT